MAISASMKIWDVAVIGEIYADHIFSGFASWPQPGEEVVAESYLRELGGGTINTACGLARLGRKTRLIGLIGENDRPWFAQRLQDFHLGTSGLVSDAAGTGVTVSVSTREDRSFFTHVGANQHLAALLGDSAIVAELCTARHVHFAMPLPRERAAVVLPQLKAAHCTTSLDVGFSPAWLGDPANRATLGEIDYFLPNQKEAALLAGSESEETFIAWARQLGLDHAVVKLGDKGALAVYPDVVHYATPPEVTALDTTGAGDAFDAGFIDALLDAEPIDGCLRRACICGALCTTQAGAIEGLPDSTQLRSYL